MIGATRSALLSTLLLAAAIVPLGAFGAIQATSMPLDKRSAEDIIAECWTGFAQDPKKCPVIQLAVFKDAECRTPFALSKTWPHAIIKGNTQMLFEGAIANSLQHPFGSVRVVGAVPGIGLGFANQEESDTVIQNMAWMSAAETYKAYQSKSCLHFPNLDLSTVRMWSIRSEDVMNQVGYVFNPYNVPIKRNVAQCRARHRRQVAGHSAVQSVCLEPASWGFGGVLEMYANDDCTGAAKRQLYTTVQCTPLGTTNFRSFKVVAPSGNDFGPIFSPVYYDYNNDTGYHACAHKGVSAKPFQPNVCQKMAGDGMFVGVYGMDPNNPQAGPVPGDKVLYKGHGHLLLAPEPNLP